MPRFDASVEARSQYYKQIWEEGLRGKGPKFHVTMNNHAGDPKVISYITRCLGLLEDVTLSKRQSRQPAITGQIDRLWELPKPFYDGEAERQALQKVLVALIKLPNLDTNLVAEIASDSEFGHIMVQFAARVYYVCRNRALAFRITAVVLAKFQLQDYFVAHEDLASSRVSVIQQGVFTKHGFLGFPLKQSPLSEDAMLVWIGIQQAWPDLANIFAKFKVEKTFLRVTQFWLKTLLLQGHVHRSEVRDHAKSEAYMIELVHRTIMVVLKDIESFPDICPNINSTAAPVYPLPVGALPPGLVSQPTPALKQEDPRRELRYMVQCMWCRKHAMLLECKTPDMLLERLGRLQYYYLVDHGLIELIHARYHDEECPTWSWFLHSALATCQTSSVGYFGALAVGTMLSMPSLSLVGLGAGVWAGVVHSQSFCNIWAQESLKQHAGEIHTAHVYTLQDEERRQRRQCTVEETQNPMLFAKCKSIEILCSEGSRSG